MKNKTLEKKNRFEGIKKPEIKKVNKLPFKVKTNFNGTDLEFDYYEPLLDHVSKLNPLFIKRFNSEQTKVKLSGSGITIKISFLI